ncbi:MAG: hypothetical protein MZV64_44100 [Ignavibacteriales bacterium]|nr:hypothetical protein [Ignavibacteriales bacterium]
MILNGDLQQQVDMHFMHLDDPPLNVKIPVPFELWNIGVKTPNDPSDDYRMVPWVVENDDDLTFNLGALDHTASSAANDPYTDWIYWARPENTTLVKLVISLQSKKCLLVLMMAQRNRSDGNEWYSCIGMAVQHLRILQHCRKQEQFSVLLQQNQML